MSPEDLAWLRGLAQCDSPVPERVVDPERVKRMRRAGLVERQWSGREWMLSVSRAGRREVVG